MHGITVETFTTQKDGGGNLLRRQACGSARRSLRPIRISLYESSIRSSVPPSYGSLVLHLSHSTNEKLCVKSSRLWLHFWGFSWCQCRWRVTRGLWQSCGGICSPLFFFFCGEEFIQQVCVSEAGGVGCSTAYSTSITWADCRAEWEAGRRPYSPFSGLHCRWYAENFVFLGCWEDEWYLAAHTFVRSYTWNDLAHIANKVDNSILQIIHNISLTLTNILWRN